MVFGRTDTGRFIAVICEWASKSPPVIDPVTAFDVQP
jgi:hypothetical protein